MPVGNEPESGFILGDWTSRAVAEIAGYVTRIRGEAVAVANNNSRPLALGNPLYLGDHIVTSNTALLEAPVQDGTVITVCPSAEFNILQVQGVSPGQPRFCF